MIYVLIGFFLGYFAMPIALELLNMIFTKTDR